MKGTAERALGKLPRKDLERVVAKVAALAAEPRPQGVEKIQGREHRFRIRSGDYRVVYDIDDARRVVTVLAIGHRRDIYRGM
jgi:mRNA interferase RelE/StbE